MIKWKRVTKLYPEYHGYDGEKHIATIVQTGRPGVDNYPWDAYSTDKSPVKFSFPADTYSSAKEKVVGKLNG